jgi:hypothetical protein
MGEFVAPNRVHESPPWLKFCFSENTQDSCRQLQLNLLSCLGRVNAVEYLGGLRQQDWRASSIGRNVGEPTFDAAQSFLRTNGPVNFEHQFSRNIWQ